MTRTETLDAAKAAITGQRQHDYGKPEDSFALIARFWAAYLGRDVTPVDVAAMMALMKLARIRATPSHQDSWVDLAGYAACGAEIATHVLAAVQASPAAPGRYATPCRAGELGVFMTRSELHASPEYKRQVEALQKLSESMQRRMVDDIERDQRELDSLRAAQHNPFAMYNAMWAAQLQASTQWCKRMYAGMQNAYVQPAPKPRRAITNSQLPRLNRHYRWSRNAA